MGPLQNIVTLLDGKQRSGFAMGPSKERILAFWMTYHSLCFCCPSSSFAIDPGVFCTITRGYKQPPKSVIKVSKFRLIYNNFVGSNSFLTKIGLKVQNIEPIKLAYILTSRYGVTIADVIHTKILNFRTFPFFISISKELVKGSWKRKRFFLISQILAEIWNFEFG